MSREVKPGSIIVSPADDTLAREIVVVEGGAEGTDHVTVLPFGQSTLISDGKTVVRITTVEEH